MFMKEIERYLQETGGKTAWQILLWAVDHFGEKDIALASSLSAEDQVLTDMLVKIAPHARIFTIDTGRLPQETYDVIAETMNRYHIHIEILCPQTGALEQMEQQYGPNLFYESVENRRLCCHTRKVEPLNRILSQLKAWICGLRKEQSVTRAAVEKIERDEAHGLYKVNPLADWTEKQVWDYIREHRVPYNKLHDQGYPSIGCAPCTRAVRPGEDIRAGRWWWEDSQHKECGLHKKPV